jgi:N-acyl homoserine lactone hydrolase
MSSLFPPLTTSWTCGGRLLRLHLISTGMGADKTRFRQARFHNKISILDAILDTRFTEWLPIRAAAIEHPEGVFLVDTGLDAAIDNPGYFKSSFVERYLRSQFKFLVTPEEGIHRQLSALNLIPQSILLTHLHFDHIGGLRYFPDTPVLLHRQEWARPYGALPKLYPPRFSPTLLDLDTSYGPFNARYLTTDKTIILIHTPGHTHGHCSVLLKTDTTHILLAGDVCYNKTQLEKVEFAANLASYHAARQTYSQIKEFARGNNLIFIAAHDANTPPTSPPASH